MPEDHGNFHGVVRPGRRQRQRVRSSRSATGPAWLARGGQMIDATSGMNGWKLDLVPQIIAAILIWTFLINLLTVRCMSAGPGSGTSLMHPVSKMGESHAPFQTFSGTSRHGVFGGDEASCLGSIGHRRRHTNLRAHAGTAMAGHHTRRPSRKPAVAASRHPQYRRAPYRKTTRPPHERCMAPLVPRKREDFVYLDGRILRVNPSPLGSHPDWRRTVTERSRHEPETMKLIGTS